jgi:hypothetical protein
MNLIASMERIAVLINSSYALMREEEKLTLS